MKIVYPEIDYVFDIEIGKVSTVIIENPKLLFELLNDLYLQIEGCDGKTVLSDEKGILTMAKSAELLTQFVPFQLSRKNLITKISTKLEEKAVEDSMYLKTMELLSAIEKYLNELSFDLNCDPVFSKINVSSVIKASGLELNEEYSSLAEKILDYFELVTEFDRKKLFITYNLRSFFSDEECGAFLKDVLNREYALLMIESSEHTLLPCENRTVIDPDLCIIR